MADREWTAECVADHFEEAFRTLRKLPPVKAQGYFNTWPDIVRTSREIAAMEPQPMRVWPSAAAITRLEQTFDWVLWIEEAERKLVWSRAVEADQRRARLRPHDCMAALATGTDQDRCAAECAVTPMCCNTFPFDICNRSMLFRRQDGESALESSLSPLR
jgi:hypothetical protein